MTSNDNIFDVYAQAYESQKQHRMSLREYLEGCRSDPSMYASTAERMLRAIGEPELVDTSQGCAARPHLHEPHHQGVPGLQGLLRP